MPVCLSEASEDSTEGLSSIEETLVTKGLASLSTEYVPDLYRESLTVGRSLADELFCLP